MGLGLDDLWNIARSFGLSAREDALKSYDVVIDLDVGESATSDKIPLFVGKGGKGEIIEIDRADFESQKEGGGINFKSVSDFSQAAEAAQLKLAAQHGAEAVSNRYALYQDLARESRAELAVDVHPFDPEHPENATAEMLPGIRDAVQLIRQYYVSEAARLKTEYGESPAESVAKVDVDQIEAVMNHIDFALEVKDYRKALETALDSADLADHQVKSIINALHAEEAPGGGGPGTDIQP